MPLHILIDKYVIFPIRWQWVANEFKLRCSVTILISQVHWMSQGPGCSTPCSYTPHLFAQICPSGIHFEAASRANRLTLARLRRVLQLHLEIEIIAPSGRKYFNCWAHNDEGYAGKKLRFCAVSIEKLWRTRILATLMISFATAQSRYSLFCLQAAQGLRNRVWTIVQTHRSMPKYGIPSTERSYNGFAKLCLPKAFEYWYMTGYTKSNWP